MTLDHVYLSVLESALPGLSGLGIPATVFVPTDFVGSAQPMSLPEIEGWHDGPYARELFCMSWDQLGELAAAGWEVGCDAICGRSLGRSRAECERQLGTCRALAYPYGDHDARVIEETRRAGYAAACTLPGRQHPAAPLCWPRVGIYPVDSNWWRFRPRSSLPLALCVAPACGKSRGPCWPGSIGPRLARISPAPSDRANYPPAALGSARSPPRAGQGRSTSCSPITGGSSKPSMARTELPV